MVLTGIQWVQRRPAADDIAIAHVDLPLGIGRHNWGSGAQPLGTPMSGVFCVMHRPCGRIRLRNCMEKWRIRGIG